MQPNSDISQELNELSPLLGNLRSEVVVPRAPEGFLEDQLPMAVWQKIDSATGNNSKPKVIHLILGMAAAAAVLLAVSLTVRFTVDSESALPPEIYASNDITRNDIILYLIDNVVELEAAEIANGLEIVQVQTVLPDEDFAAANDWLEEHVDVLDLDILTEELL